MFTQEVIKVCDMQAAQCFAQASCYGGETIVTAANGVLGRYHSQQLKRRQLSLACITPSTMARLQVRAERISRWLCNDL